MDIVEQAPLNYRKPLDVAIRVGDTLNVYVRLHEAGKERTQMFSGVVIKIQGKQHTRSFTVRKVSNEIGVERTFPFMSPALEKVEIVSRAKVRRSRLFYLRKLRGREARLKTVSLTRKNTSS